MNAYLASKGLEVARVKVLWQNSLGKGVGRMENQQATTPFHNPRVLLGDKHVMKPFDELVEPDPSMASGRRGASYLRKSWQRTAWSWLGLEHCKQARVGTEKKG